MGKPLTIQNEDDARLVSLKEKVGARSKVEVLRKALDLFENEVKREERLVQWGHAARLVSKQSAKVNRSFQAHSRLKHL